MIYDLMKFNFCYLDSTDARSFMIGKLVVKSENNGCLNIDNGFFDICNAIGNHIHKAQVTVSLLPKCKQKVAGQSE